MAQNPSALKRQKEIARLEWQKEKAAKRKQRTQEKKENPKGEQFVTQDNVQIPKP